MKKTYISITLLAVLAAFGLTSCSESEPYMENLYNSTSFYCYGYGYIGADSNEGYFEVSSNVSWRASTPDSWIHLSKTSGYGNDYGSEKIAFTVDDNTGNTRYGTINVVTTDGYPSEETIEVTQAKTKTVPFEIYDVKVGNVDYNGNIINNYGSTIWANQTQFLVPRIYVHVYKAGTYTIYYKMYKPTGDLVTISDSPTGYTDSYTYSMYSSSSYFGFYGIGQSISGWWSAGNYKYEFYYDGNKIAEKEFTVYKSSTRSKDETSVQDDRTVIRTVSAP